MLNLELRAQSLDILTNIVDILTPQLKSSVIKAGLRIWPDSDWPEFGETELLLEFLDEDGSTKCLHFGYSEDQEHLVVREGVIEPSRSFDEIEARRIEWRKYDRMDTEGRQWETLALEDSEHYGWLKNNTIVQIELICSLPYFVVTEIVVRFYTGNELWIVGGHDGCAVKDSGVGVNWGSDRSLSMILDKKSIPKSMPRIS